MKRLLILALLAGCGADDYAAERDPLPLYPNQIAELMAAYPECDVNRYGAVDCSSPEPRIYRMCADDGSVIEVENHGPGVPLVAGKYRRC